MLPNLTGSAKKNYVPIKYDLSALSADFIGLLFIIDVQ